MKRTANPDPTADLNAVLLATDAGQGNRRPSSVHGMAVQVMEVFLSEADGKLVTPRHMREQGDGYLPEAVPDLDNGSEWLRDAAFRSYERGDGFEQCAQLLQSGGPDRDQLVAFARRLEEVESRNSARLTTLVWANHIVAGDESLGELLGEFGKQLVQKWMRELKEWQRLSIAWEKAHPTAPQWAKPRNQMALTACRHFDVLPRSWRSAMASARYDPTPTTGKEDDSRGRGGRRSFG